MTYQYQHAFKSTTNQDDSTGIRKQSQHTRI